jgi:O-antigen/teichoic acid export membrane protein
VSRAGVEPAERRVAKSEKEATPTGSTREASLHEAARATRLLFFGQVVGKAFHFLLDLVVGRVLGPAGFGIVSASSSLILILSETALLGSHRAVLRFASLDGASPPGKRSRAITRRGNVIALAGGCVCVAGMVVFRKPVTHLLFQETVSPWLLPAFAVAIPAIGIFSVLQFRARAERCFLEDSMIGNVARQGLPLLATGICLALGWRLWGGTFGFVAGTIATVPVAVWLTRERKEARSEERRASKDANGTARANGDDAGAAASIEPGYREFLSVALPLALAGASILLMQELDKVMLAIFRPEREVGVYNAAYRISRQAILLLPALNAAISPWVAPLFAQGRLDHLSQLYRQTTKWSFAAGFSAALFLAVFAKDFLGLFGTEYLAGVPVLVMLSMGQLVNAAVGNAGVVLQFSGHERAELANGVLVTGLNVALNVAFIPLWGATGAAVATLVSLALVALRRLNQVRTLLGVYPYDRSTLVVAGAGVAAVLAAIAFRALAALGSSSCFVLVSAACAGFVVAWVAALRVIGVTESEAQLLRVPRRWIRGSNRP